MIDFSLKFKVPCSRPPACEQKPTRAKDTVNLKKLSVVRDSTWRLAILSPQFEG